MMPRRKDSTSRSEGVITEGEINVIFSNIVEILNLNQILLQVRTPPPISLLLLLLLLLSLTSCNPRGRRTWRNE
jgi:hypothetical protein